MKKLLCLALAIAAVLSLTVLLTSCNDEGKEETLKMVTNAYFAPYEYFEGDKIVGIDAEIAEAIGKKIGK